MAEQSVIEYCFKSLHLCKAVNSWLTLDVEARKKVIAEIFIKSLREKENYLEEVEVLDNIRIASFWEFEICICEPNYFKSLARLCTLSQHSSDIATSFGLVMQLFADYVASAALDQSYSIASHKSKYTSNMFILEVFPFATTAALSFCHSWFSSNRQFIWKLWFGCCANIITQPTHSEGNLTSKPANYKFYLNTQSNRLLQANTLYVGVK